MSESSTTLKVPELLWYKKLRFRIFLFFVFLSITVTSISSFVIYSHSKKMTVELTHGKLDEAQESILIGLSGHMESAKSLVSAMAIIALTNDFDPEQLHKIIPKLKNAIDAKLIIAGGGIWPEPLSSTTPIKGEIDLLNFCLMKKQKS